jgi:hypothetical protein
MNAILAIDPGVAVPGCACAAFKDARLLGTWFERVRDEPLACEIKFGRVIVERPVLQGDRTRAARPQDLMALAWEGAMLAGMYAGRDSTDLIAWPASDTKEHGRGWKGSEPKPVQHARLWAALDPAERLILGGDPVERAIMKAREKGALNRWSRPGASYYPRTFITHNLLDAVALGATYLGRIVRTG